MLKPWKENIIPNKVVAEGRMQEAKFAVNLAEILKGTAEREYQDPQEFFDRTYMTKGMKSVLASAFRRVNNQGGDPIAKPKTPFGGGKSHVSAALYHILRNSKILENHPKIKEFLKENGFEKIPNASISVLVGTDLDIAKPMSIPGVDHKINTLWGLMAYQLGKEDGYNIVKESDVLSVSPGASTLVDILDRFGPSVIIIDELILYIRNAYNASDPKRLISGSFESLMTFMQNLTEAVKRSKNSMMIISMPESDIEIGGEGGKVVLDSIEKILGRVEAIWWPTEAKESFEIVRGKLFGSVINEKYKEDVCEAFYESYKENPDFFPVECKDLAYLERLKNTYPLHPELFDILYLHWSTLPKFQKTRGFLRHMAGVIHELWISDDRSLLIMPGSIPLYSPKVREELTKCLPLEEGWNSIIDNDIDGERSEAKKIDKGNIRIGQFSSARKITRTIFLGSAPSPKEQRNRGIDTTRILLGTVQPGDNIPTFRDALDIVAQRLTYIYNNRNRYWYDSHPNLNKVVTDKIKALDEKEVYAESKRRLNKIAERLEKSKRKKEFPGIYICLESRDIPDESDSKLVVLCHDQLYIKDDKSCSAITNAMKILETKGNSSRIYRNTLIFSAADHITILDLNNDIREYLAWFSIFEDKDALNLDMYQTKQVEINVKNADNKVESKLNDVYCWLLVPIQDGTNPIIISSLRIKEGGKESFIFKAYKQAINDGHIVTKLSPEVLIAELDKNDLWKDNEYINTKQLSEYLARYPYLQRLKDMNVLIDCIKDGVKRKLLGYASRIDEKSGKYLELEFGNPYAIINIDSMSVLLKGDVALKQQGGYSPPPVGGTVSVGAGLEQTDEISKHLKKSFYGKVELNPTRLVKDTKKIADEIVQILDSIPESDIKILLEIIADVPSGIPENKEMAIKENCSNLQFVNYYIE